MSIPARLRRPRVDRRAGIAPRVAARFALVLCLLLHAAPVRADVTIAPSPDGYFGAWLAASLPAGVPAERVLVGGSKNAATTGYVPFWQPIGTAEWAIDLVRVLHIAEGFNARAAVAGVVSSPRPLDALLLVGSEGKIAIFVDGNAIFRRAYGTHSLSWEVVPLALPAGEHQVVIELEKKSDRWNFAARLLDAADLMPPDGTVLRLPGFDDKAGARLLDAMLQVDIRMHASAAGVQPIVAVRVPRGVPVLSDRRITVGWLGPAPASERSFSLGALLVTPRGAHDVECSLPIAQASAAAAVHQLHVDVGGIRRVAKFQVDPKISDLLRRASDMQRRLRPSATSGSDVVSSTLEARMQRLSELIPDDPGAADKIRSLEKFVSILERGADPIREQTGVTEWVHRSRLDGSPHSFLLHVPQSYDPRGTKSYPLVVVLHGFRGNPDGILKAFIDRDSHDSRAAVDGFVLAPEAFGDAFYRGPGEAEVMDLTHWVEETFPIDRHRVSISGVSMGGTGAAQIAFRYADEFSAAAPLAGYHSYFIRRDTAGKPLRSWEKPLMHHFSTVSWADNGHHLFLYVAQGLRDTPLENSRVLTRRYGELGYELTSEWPATGHAVWKVTYSGARLWPVLTARRSPEAPAKVTLVTDRLRYGRQYWITVDSIDSPLAMARVDAEVLAPRHVAVSTSNVLRLSIARPTPRVEANGAVTVTIDGKDVEMSGDGPLSIARSADGWHPSARPTTDTQKHAGVEGAIEDAYMEPLVFVYGTLAPNAARANREAAEYLATVYTGSAAYPVIADVAFDQRLAETHSLVLVGAAGSNAVLSAIEARLPVRADAKGIALGAQRYESPEIGALFIYPHPDHPNRYVLVVTATGCRGIWRARSLPRLLPDFVIYDEHSGPAAGEQVLGDASVRAAGFFNRDWTVPAL